MKKLIFSLLLCCGLTFAQTNNNNGLGFWIADYGWGIDLKHLNGNTAWDVYLGSNFNIDAGFYFIYNNIIKADASAGSFPLYWGPNIGLEWDYADGREYDGTKWERNYIIIRPNIVGGFSWFMPTPIKMELSLELYAFPFEFATGSYKRAGHTVDSGSSLNKRFGSNFLHVRVLYHIYLF